MTREDQLLNRSEIIPSRTDVLSMAREAGIDEELPNVEVVYKSQWFSCTAEELERFAALIASRVAAHVRETEFKPDWNNYRQGLADGAAEEREACAKVCESLFDMEDDSCNEAEQCAAAIRARGNT